MSSRAVEALPGLALLAGALGLASFGFVGCSSSECSGGACAAVDAGRDEDSAPVCPPNTDPKDNPACLDDAFGVFVDKEGGNDSNPGTKGAPVQSIGVALGKLEGKRRVYVCEGNYFEHVTLTKPVSVHGGFACSTWSYTGVKARLAPNDSGYILQVALVPEPVVVTDLALEAVNGTGSGASSIGAFITRSSSVTLRRMSISAGTGAAGADANDASDYVPASAPDGYAGDDAAQPGKARQNPGCMTSIGGAGAREDGATPARSGQVSISPAFPGANSGAGGKSGVACTAGGNGIDGSFGVAGIEGAGAASFGALDTTGWKPTDGAPGGRGGDGQGGGGGGQIAGLGIGGGGGPGGCGGAGGEKGSAGGSSIALLVFDSAVTVESSSLIAKDGGNGGKGGKGQKAQLGSAIASGPSLAAEACSGGLGGVGGSGGGGGGGAGGLAVGILYKGPAPIIDGASTSTADTLGSVTLGAPGIGGAKGIGGDAAQTSAPASRPGADGTAGIDGVAKAVVSVP